MLRANLTQPREAPSRQLEVRDMLKMLVCKNSCLALAKRFQMHFHCNYPTQATKQTRSVRILQAAGTNDKLRLKREGKTCNTFTNKTNIEVQPLNKTRQEGGHGRTACVSSVEARLSSRGDHRSGTVEVARCRGLAHNRPRRGAHRMHHTQLQAHTWLHNPEAAQKTRHEERSPTRGRERGVFTVRRQRHAG